MTLDPDRLQLEVVEVEASATPFSIQQPDQVWMVESGALNLFLVTGGCSQPTGARYPLMRIEAGEAIFGIGEELAGDRQLMATATPQTKLRHFSSWRFGDLAVHSHGPTLPILERWMNRLAELIAEGADPAELVTVLPNMALSVGEQSQTIVPREGVVWVSHQTGASRLLGKEVVRAGVKHFFPVCKNGWLEVEPRSVLHFIDSRTLCQLDPEGNALQEFHKAVMFSLLDKQKRDQQSERERQRTACEADKASVHDALLELVAPLEAISDAGEGERAIEDPIFAAAEKVCQQSGITLKPLPKMRRGTEYSDPILAIARASGVRVRRIQLHDGWWKEDAGPLLGFRDSDHRPLALLPDSSRSYEAYDPVRRSATGVTREMSLDLGPSAFMFYRPFPARALNIFDLLKFAIAGCQKELAVIVGMGVLAGLIGIIPPYATGIMFDRLIPGAERSQLIQLAAILLVFAATASMFTLTRGFAVLRLQGKMDIALQAAMWDRLLSLPVRFFRDYGSGDLAERSLGIAEIGQILTGSTLTIILSGLFSVFSLLLLFYYSWELALVAASLVLFECLISAGFILLQIQYQREIFSLAGRISSLLLELVSGISKFRVAGAEGRAFARWARQFAKRKQVVMHARKLSNSLTVFNAVFPIISLAVIFYFGWPLESHPQAKQISTGEFIAFVAAFIQFLTAALLVTSSVPSVLGIVPLYERTRPILHALPEIQESNNSPHELIGGIEISHVTFRYGSDSPAVVRDLCLRILPGQFVALVGVSGSGKSTLFRLLLAFERPESGAIFLDGRDLVGLDSQMVRRQMGVVLQTSRLVSGDILTNIVGSSRLTIKDAWQAAHLVGIDEDIKRMPMGMYTLIGEGGAGISGGQRQRILIARAIVAKPRVLLLDEATSALDNQTQEIVSRSLESLHATRVVIAHRLSTVLRADQIFVIDKGSVIQSGTYEVLIKQEGLFRDLVSRQLV